MGIAVKTSPKFSALALLLACSPAAFAQGFTPEEAAKRMQLPEGFTVRVVAAEPTIRQPVSMSFDSRGRLWVLQYLQYPNPAGLKPVKQDQYLRTIWDRVPEPPPAGPKGADRLTILYDPDEHGVYRKSKDFVGGLNLACGFCIGNGGVYVVQPPYLLFYPDKDEDDVPDGDPQVLLSGFGLDDTHSLANSLQLGPDGWLYGAAGSTSTCKIPNPANLKEIVEFQQGIWRYHPKSKVFEMFSEGGGNTYGLDFDKHGQAIAGTNFGNVAMLHQMQGAYHIKGFSKHGPLHNPHTYGYFDHVPYKNFKGGHVTCGGIIYQGDTFPKEYQDQYIAANLLSNCVNWHKLTPNGSTFKAEHGGDFLTANDTWFRPIDLMLGPDGSVYVADWTDKRAAHRDPIDSWDKTNGRIYKIEYKGTPKYPTFDLRTKSSPELVELLKHPNAWWRREARRLLGERGDVSVVVELKKLIETGRDTTALEGLWALHAVIGLNDATAAKLLRHGDEHQRAWTVRFLGDRPRTKQEFPNYSPPGADVSPDLVNRLLELARSDPSALVRAQLACTAKRLDRSPGLALASALAARDEDANDAYIPLLIWWAMEPHFAIPALAHQRIGLTSSSKMRDFLAERIARRTAAADLETVDTPDNRTDPDPPELRKNKLVYTPEFILRASEHLHPAMLRGVEMALDGRSFQKLLPEMDEWLNKLVGKHPTDENLFRIRLRFNHGDALATAHGRIADAKRPEGERVKLIQLLGQIRRSESLPVLMTAFREEKSDALRIAAIAAAQSFGDQKVSIALLAAFPKLTGTLRAQSLASLFSRPATALSLLELVEAKAIDPASIPVEHLRVAMDFKDSKISTLVEKHWGKVGPATPGEKLARIASLNAAIPRGTADLAAGKDLFAKHCIVCHTLFGEGGKVGPDLTTADRKNRQYLLTHIVDPSAYIRPEFVSHKIDTADGRAITGLVESGSGESIALLNVIDNKPQRTVIAKKDIDKMVPLAVSLMPEKMLDAMTDADVRNLFAYLMIDEKKAPPAKAAGGKTFKVMLISGSLEYKSDESLPLLQKYLEENYPIQCVRAFRKTDTDIPGLDKLAECDAAIFFTRRLKIDGEQLDAIKKFVESGKPVVGIRTASHGFQNWLEMDKLVFGGDYKNHYGAGPKCEVKIVEAAKDHPILKGVKPYASTGSLYRNAAVEKDATVLLTGTSPEHTEPIAWIRERKLGEKVQRVFYTSLGHPDDFADANFLKLVGNGLAWTLKIEAPVPK